MSQLGLQLFSAPRIIRDGKTLHVDTRKALALLAYLVVSGGHQSRDTLAALFWAEADHASARGALRRTLSTLNTTLDNQGLQIERESVALMNDHWDCDLLSFQQLLRPCSHPITHPTDVCSFCASDLSHAARLYRGNFLQGFSLKDSPEFDTWQSQQTEYYRRLQSTTLERLVRWYSQQTQHTKALDYAQQLLALDPLHEPAHQHLIQLYALCGQRSAALRQYQECIRVLNDELGVTPLEETTSLYLAVLEHTLQPNPRHDPTIIAPMQHETTTPTIVGRDDAMQHLHRWIDRDSREKAGLFVISGETGIGKSLVVHTFVEQLQPQKTLSGRCYESESTLAYAPFVNLLREALVEPHWVEQLAPHWLEELVRLVPELKRWQKESTNGDTVNTPIRLFEALYQALCVLFPEGGILLIDDAHWLDQASLDALTYLLRRLIASECRVLLTWRTDDTTYVQALRRLKHDYERGGGKATSHELQRLDWESVREITQASGHDAALSERLFEESEGLPLFLHELLLLAQTTKKTEWTIPPSVQGILRSRLDAISETARQLLSTAAVIGRAFDIDFLRECSGRSDDETVEGVEECLQHGLIRETTPTEQYEFYHEKLRDILYQDTSLARRRLLHRRAAQSLIHRIRHPQKLAPIAALIAAHWQKGGEESEATDYYVKAGIYARHVYANREALTYFETALALGTSDPKLAHEQCGDLHVLLGEYRSAIQSYETALAHAHPADIPALQQRLGNVYHRRGEWLLAESYYQAAYEDCSAEPSPLLATLFTDWSLTKMSRGQINAAWDLAEQALSIADRIDDAHLKAQAHNMLGILSRKRDDYLQATRHLNESLHIAKSLHEPRLHVAALNNVALNMGHGGHYDQAQQAFEEALILCIQQGDLHHEAAIRNNLADVYHATQQSAQAMEQLKKAVALFAQIGVQEIMTQPEIWKLAEW